MKLTEISALLEPYITGLTATQITQVSTYLDLLVRWNAKTNLTAIRNPEQIVSRHFGESFFLAQTLFGPDLSCELLAEQGGGILTSTDIHSGVLQLPITNYKLPILDLGSGAGFPGIPLKIAFPDITLMLVEAHHTKAVFLREVLRALELNAEVKNVRAEDLPPGSASLVTLRAVEHFESILPIAAHLVRRCGDPETRPGGTTENSPALQRRGPDADLSSAVGTSETVHCPPFTVHGLALLISSPQIAQAHQILPNWRFHPGIPIPKSQNRVIQLVEPNQ